MASGEKDAWQVGKGMHGKWEDGCMSSAQMQAWQVGRRMHGKWGDGCIDAIRQGTDSRAACRSPPGGKDVGDHPPITPVRSATEVALGGGDTWQVYDYVARHFIASVSPDCRYTK